MWLGAPFFSSSRRVLFARTMSVSLTVKSSSLRPSPSLWTDGRTCGGGMGNTVSTIQSGRAYCGLNPILFASVSVMLLRMACARSGWTSSFRSCSSVDSLNSALIMRPSRLKFGCGAEQDQQVGFVFAKSITARSRCAGFFFLVAAWSRWLSRFGTPSSGGSSPRMTEHEKQTQRSALSVVLMKEQWYIGFVSTRCPKCPGHSCWSMPHVWHSMARSIAPSRRSIRPP
mmetsp:Transcript_39970/g.80065  ORF Transcript_39970/g.80065 Transcript_39970/m.80065 type:complete len:228 (+) Transcript_39970:3833-4516(+)